MIFDYISFLQVRTKNETLEVNFFAKINKTNSIAMKILSYDRKDLSMLKNEKCYNFPLGFAEK